MLKIKSVGLSVGRIWQCQRLHQRQFSGIKTVELAYDLWKPRDAPQAPPIVFMHGLFGFRHNNRSVSRVLARDLKCEVYCVDLRNHGDSPHTEIHNYKAMAADVNAFIAQHKLEKPILIGHSMGARVAMALALEKPELISKCIPVDNGPVTMRLSGSFPQYVRGMMEVDRAKCKSQKEAVEVIKPFAEDIGVQQFLLANFKREDGVLKCRIPLEILLKSLDNVGEFNYMPTEYRFTKPTLLIRGTKSKFVPDEALPLMGELFPRFEVKDIVAGHWVISENPKAFLETTLEFLAPKD